MPSSVCRATSWCKGEKKEILSRFICIGDIHGCLEEFQELLRVVEFRSGKDELIQLGDFMDRGPDPVGCLRVLREKKARVVLGNHDERHLRWRRHEAVRKETGRPNPMRPLDEERLKLNQALSEDDVRWLEGLPFLIRFDSDWVAVHGGVEPAFPLGEQKLSHVVRVRYVDENGEMASNDGDFSQPPGSVPWMSAWKGHEHVVYGHAVHSLERPTVKNRCVGIDTGCVYGGRLTAMVLYDEKVEFVQVQSRRAYADFERVPLCAS